MSWFLDVSIAWASFFFWLRFVENLPLAARLGVCFLPLCFQGPAASFCGFCILKVDGKCVLPLESPRVNSKRMS